MKRLRSLLRRLRAWLRSDSKDSLPPYPLNSWSQLPPESWPEGYDPSKDPLAEK
jgi:hypothetical protein